MQINYFHDRKITPEQFIDVLKRSTLGERRPVEGQVVGFYALGEKNGRLDLLNLWVLPGWMGRGIGRALFNHAVARAKALGFREIKIESDPNAEGFYLRMGARRIGVSVHMVEGQRRELPVLTQRIVEI